MRSPRILIPCLFGIAVLFPGCAAHDRVIPPASSAPLVHAAEPLLHPGLPNCYRVSGVLYRGAQPSRDGFAYLETMGIKTVVDLRLHHSDEEDLEGTSLRYVGIPMQVWDPELHQLREFLSIVTDPQCRPVFVHCRRGADRTGVMVAAYRMVAEGWTTEQAIDEMMEGPFAFSELAISMPRFLRQLDVESLRTQYIQKADPPAPAIRPSNGPAQVP